MCDYLVFIIGEFALDGVLLICKNGSMHIFDVNEQNTWCIFQEQQNICIVDAIQINGLMYREKKDENYISYEFYCDEINKWVSCQKHQKESNDKKIQFYTKCTFQKNQITSDCYDTSDVKIMNFDNKTQTLAYYYHFNRKDYICYVRASTFLILNAPLNAKYLFSLHDTHFFLDDERLYSINVLEKKVTDASVLRHFKIEGGVSYQKHLFFFAKSKYRSQCQQTSIVFEIYRT